MKSRKERRTGRVVNLQPKRGKAGGARPAGTAPRSAPGLQLRFGPQRAPLPPCGSHRSRPAPPPPAAAPGTAGPGQPPRLLCFGTRGGTRREASRGAGTWRRPQAPRGRPRGAVRCAGCGAVRGRGYPSLTSLKRGAEPTSALRILRARGATPAAGPGAGWF